MSTSKKFLLFIILILSITTFLFSFEVSLARPAVNISVEDDDSSNDNTPHTHTAASTFSTDQCKYKKCTADDGYYYYDGSCHNDLGQKCTMDSDGACN